MINSIRLRANQFSVYCLISIAFFLPLYKKIVPPLIFLLFLLWFFQKNYKNIPESIKKNRIIFIFIIFYFIHLFGIFYSSNIISGLFDLQVKFSILLLPILLLSMKEQDQMVNNQKIFLSFIFGNIVASLICLSHSLYLMIKWDASFDYFYYVDLSILLHPGYFSIYLCMSFVILLHLLEQNFSGNKIKSRTILFLLAILFHILMIYLLSSKTNLLLLVIICTLYLLYKLKTKNLFLKALLGFVFAILLTTSANFNPRLNYAVTLAKKMTLSEFPVENEQNESNQMRVEIISNSIKIIKNNFWFGVGTGDVKDELISSYKINKNNFLEEKKLNAHNQYFETFIGLGVFGELSLISMLFLPLYHFMRNKNYPGILFILICSFNFLFESVLNTQAGVVFFAFFLNLLLIYPNENSGINSTGIISS